MFGANRELSLRLFRYGWNNDSFAGDVEYLATIAEYAAQTDGPILECGSGISTIILSLACRTEVWALEHIEEWCGSVRKACESSGLRNVKVVHAPLCDYGNFHWYSVPECLPPRFSLVICDGPPGTTVGGRYGLLPLMRHRLEAGAKILLDDAEREDEQRVLKSWQAGFSVGVETTSGHKGSLAIVTV